MIYPLKGLYSKNDNEATDFGLDDAIKIVKITNSKIKYIPDKISKKKDPLGKIYSDFSLKTSRYFNGVGISEMNIKKNVEKVAEYAIFSGIGNCAENACVSAIIAKDFKGINNIEIFGMTATEPEIGHAFVVVNRDENSDDSKMSTWGKKAIVIDSWSGIAFKASEFPSDVKGKKHPEFPKGYPYMELKKSEF